MNEVGILYPGALGSALGRRVTEAGGTPVTCLSGRSVATCKRAAAEAFSVTSSLGELARRVDLVVSLVPPHFAVEVARNFVRDVRPTWVGLPVFVDANSACPRQKRQIARILSDARLACVDAAFFGPANQIGPDNLLVLSGPGAEQVAPFFQRIVEVQVAGPRIGASAALKMALGILTKALCALFLEMICASGSQGQLDTVLDLMWRLYPGTMRFVERSLPTYPAHIARKADELEHIIDWLHEVRVHGCMTQGALDVLRRLEGVGLEQRVDWQFKDLLRQIFDRGFLRFPRSMRSTRVV